LAATKIEPPQSVPPVSLAPVPPGVVAVPAADQPDEMSDALPPVEPPAPEAETNGANWPDDSAEAAFLADARERGEVVVAARPAESAEENESTPLPSLDDLVQRIPPEVREALEDLFRARFVTVKRVPKKVLTR
jgi:hypothetical protein